MTESKLKTSVGWFLLASHLLMALAVFALFLRGGFLFEEMTTTLALISPILAVHTSAVVRSIMAEPFAAARPARGRRVHASYLLLSLTLPVLFILGLGGLIASKVCNLLTFEQFKTMLAVLESGFGIYLGSVVGQLFKVATKPDTP